MKKILLALLILPAIAEAQSNKIPLHLYRQVTEAPASSLRILVKGDPALVRDAVKKSGGEYLYASGDISSVSITASSLPAFVHDPAVKEIGEGYFRLRPLNDTMKIVNNISPVHAGMAPLPQGYDGEGVLMGIIDSGIDFTHPDFLDSANKTRILYIWDQNPASGSSVPQPYNYGIEWRKSQIDSGLCTHDDLAHYGHGTHVSGIAAGDGSSTNALDYRGVAYKSDLIVVALNFYSSGPVVADAVDYIFSKANALGRPCVINASVGDYYGSHDGKDLQSQLIDNLLTAQTGRSLVGASGNAGDLAIHLGYTANSDTSFTWYVPPSSGPLYIQLWGDTNSFGNTQIAIAMDESSGFTRRGRSAFTTVAQNLSGITNDSILNASNNRLASIQRVGSTQADAYQFEFLVTPDSINGYYISLLATGSGTFHNWSFDLYSGALPAAAQMPQIVYYKNPDTTHTVVSSFQCSNNVICVGNFVNRERWLNYNNVYTFDNTVTAGAIMWNSSVGPTRDGRIKPDITATGANIVSCGVLSMLPGIISSAPTAVGAGGFHVVGGGTSAASPVVAGIAALYLQRYPTASCWDVKNAIVNCSRTDAFTGTNLPDVTWGNGKVDAMSALVGCPMMTSNSSLQQNIFEIMPNPAKQYFDLVSDEHPFATTVLIYDATGRLVASEQLPAYTHRKTISCSGLVAGLYLCALSENGHIVASRRLVIE